MLVIGGMQSLTGAVLGVVLVTLASEVLRNLERGMDFGAFAVPPLYGASQIVLGVIFILVMIFRPSGIMGDRELTLGRFRQGKSKNGRRSNAMKYKTLHATGWRWRPACLGLGERRSRRDTIKVGAPFNVTGALSSLDAPALERRQAEDEGDQRRRRHQRQADRARRLRHQDRPDRHRLDRQPARRRTGAGRHGLHRFRLGAGASGRSSSRPASRS